MTYFVLYTDVGLVGVTNTTPFIDFSGLSIDSIEGDIPNLNNVVWDNTTHEFTVINNKISKLDFMSRFSSAERIAVQSSLDPILKDAMNLLQLSEFIDITDQRTMMLVGYLAMTDVIPNSRVAEILA